MLRPCSPMFVIAASPIVKLFREACLPSSFGLSSLRYCSLCFPFSYLFVFGFFFFFVIFFFFVVFFFFFLFFGVPPTTRDRVFYQLGPAVSPPMIRIPESLVQFYAATLLYQVGSISCLGAFTVWLATVLWVNSSLGLGILTAFAFLFVRSFDHSWFGVHLSAAFPAGFRFLPSCLRVLYRVFRFL